MGLIVLRKVLANEAFQVNTAPVAPKSTAKRKQSISGDTLRITQTLGAFRGGSLPNVSGPQPVGTIIIDLKVQKSISELHSSDTRFHFVHF